MSILTVLELQAADGMADQVAAVLKKHLGATRARPGCESVTVHRDMAEPNSIVLVERWASRADDEAYRVWRAGEGAVTEMAPLVVGMTIRYVDDVDA